jgi:hypothetical protein
MSVTVLHFFYHVYIVYIFTIAIGVQRWVSKWVEDNYRPPILCVCVFGGGEGGHSRNGHEAVLVVARLQGIEG